MTQPILLNDFRAEPEALLQQEIAAAERVIRSGWYILGQEVKAFEQTWARQCGVGYAVGVGNGMDAIEIGLRALGIGEGAEVITTPMTAFATVLAILRAGATPVLADIDPTTALLDPASVARCITPKTRAVLPVHLYGQVRQMERWQELCNNYHLTLIEDCAQAHLAQWNGKVAGSFGAWGAYSFYPTKNLGALGDAGALVTDNEEIARKAGMLRNYGQSERYHHPELGLNSRLDEMQAALLRTRLDWLQPFTQRRQEIAAIYQRELRNPAVRLLASPAATENHVYHLFVICCERRDALMVHLRELGITSLIHYPVPLHRQPPCLQIGRDPAGLSAAEDHAATCLSLPCHPQMSDGEVERVVEAVNRF